MYATQSMWMAQDRINERLAEAQRERLIRAARAAAPRAVEFHGATGSFASNLVAPVKQFFAAIAHAVHQPAARLGKNPTHA